MTLIINVYIKTSLFNFLRFVYSTVEFSLVALSVSLSSSGLVVLRILGSSFQGMPSHSVCSEVSIGFQRCFLFLITTLSLKHCRLLAPDS